MDHDSWFSGMGLLMWFVLLGIPAVLVVGIYLLFTQGRSNKNPQLEVLEERYALGEIGEKEFLEMKNNLSK